MESFYWRFELQNFPHVLDQRSVLRCEHPSIDAFRRE
ncbi:protein of unknown function [Ralstonia solanacearum CFBP2957]|nr:protein of unknown function [Ralstonia solanacearum CFBP2957]